MPQLAFWIYRLEFIGQSTKPIILGSGFFFIVSYVTLKKKKISFLYFFEIYVFADFFFFFFWGVFLLTFSTWVFVNLIIYGRLTSQRIYLDFVCVCVRDYKLKSQLNLLFSFFFLIFMSFTIFFGIIYKSHSTISANFYLYLQYFQ